MTISLVSTDAITECPIGNTTNLSVTIGTVSVGDLIVIPYMVRSALTSIPLDFDVRAEINLANYQTSGFLVKTSDGTESGTSITVTQSSSARMEIFHAIFRSTTGGLTYSQAAEVDAGASSGDATLPALTEAGPFLALCAASNLYSNQNGDQFSIEVGSDTEFSELLTEWRTGVSGNRIQAFQGIYSGADTTTLIVGVGGATGYDWAASMATFVESGTPPPSLSLYGQWRMNGAEMM